MNETIYLVDNNALLALKGERIRSEFFRLFCRVTSDVLAEAGTHPDRARLEDCVLERSPAMLESVRDVMKLETPGAADLIDLYKNKGAADPGLLAAILVEQSASVGTFFADEWVLVTSDAAVIDRAGKLGIISIAPRELSARMDVWRPIDL